MFYPELIGRDQATLLQLEVAEQKNTAKVRELFANDGATDADLGQYRQHSVRVTWSKKSLWLQRPLTLELADDEVTQKYNIEIEWLAALLTPDACGLLIAKVQCSSTSLAEVATLTRHLKKIYFRRRLTVDVPQFRMLDGRKTSWQEIFGEVLDKIGRPVGDYSESQGVNWNLAVIAGLSADEPIGGFSSALEAAAFGISVGRPPSELPNHPAPSHMTELRFRNSLNLWTSWTEMYNYDNLVFVADASNARLSKEFSAHLEIFEHEYLMIFAATLIQSSAIDYIATDIALSPSGVQEASDHLDNLEVRLARLNTRLWFEQISTTPVGKPLYQLLKNSLYLERYHQQTSADVDRLRRHLEARRARIAVRATRRTETLLQVLTVVALPLTLYVTLLAPKLLEFEPVKAVTPKAYWITMGVMAGILLALLALLRRKTRLNRDEL